jgi:hypothetical protein
MATIHIDTSTTLYKKMSMSKLVGRYINTIFVNLSLFINHFDFDTLFL